MGDYEDAFGADEREDIDFSPDLRKVVKNVETVAEHWLESEAVQVFNDAIHAFLAELAGGSIEALEGDRAKKKVMAPAHALAGLRAKGFGPVADELEAKHPELFKVKKRQKKAKDDGMSEQELLELQQQLFAKAKAKAGTDEHAGA